VKMIDFFPFLWLPTIWLTWTLKASQDRIMRTRLFLFFFLLKRTPELSLFSSHAALMDFLSPTEVEDL